MLTCREQNPSGERGGSLCLLGFVLFYGVRSHTVPCSALATAATSQCHG